LLDDVLRFVLSSISSAGIVMEKSRDLVLTAIVRSMPDELIGGLTLTCNSRLLDIISGGRASQFANGMPALAGKWYLALNPIQAISS
jgi:hypothetical protein